VTPDKEMSKRMTHEYERKMKAQSSYYDFIMDTAKDDPVGAAVMLCTGLMRGNKDSLQLGYDLGAAMIATLNQIPLTNQQVGIVLNRIAVPKPGIVDYGPTPRD
jgi:hypothetical protein